MHTKNFIVTGALALLALILIVFFVYNLAPSSGNVSKNENGGIVPSENIDDITNGQNEEIVSRGEGALPPSKSDSENTKIKADIFVGTLEKVDTGCFADGECFIEVSGKHVTAIMGWSTETVGSIKGVDGFGSLESHIGEKIEVYAQEKIDGTYTLYGSEGFYIKLLEGDIPIRNPIDLVAPHGCMIGGCSGQLCVDAATGGDMASTCEYRSEYACYKSAECERQSTGKCGWTESEELRACIQNAGFDSM